MLERISRQERFDLLIAWGAVSLAFAIIFLKESVEVSGKVDPVTALSLIGISLVTVGIGFVAHEMAHKFTAIKFGYWAEFRKDNKMLLVAVVLAALVGVVFAAPGATIIYADNRAGGGISREQNGRISAAGPATNLLLCIPFAGLLAYGGTPSMVYASLASLIGMMGLQVNAMIAAFNMLPVSVLDGKKVLAWNAGIFAVLIVAAFVTVLLSYYPALV